METLAARIVGRRSELGLTSTDLANLVGISLPAVLKWEGGLTSNLKHEHLFLLADALNVTPRWLALGDGQKIASPAREAYRLALARREEADTDKAKRVWERLAATFARAALVAAFFILPPSIDNAQASFSSPVSGLCIMLNRMLQRFRHILLMLSSNIAKLGVS